MSLVVFKLPILPVCRVEWKSSYLPCQVRHGSVVKMVLTNESTHGFKHLKDVGPSLHLGHTHRTQNTRMSDFVTGGNHQQVCSFPGTAGTGEPISAGRISTRDQLGSSKIDCDSRQLGTLCNLTQDQQTDNDQATHCTFGLVAPERPCNR